MRLFRGRRSPAAFLLPAPLGRQRLPRLLPVLGERRLLRKKGGEEAPRDPDAPAALRQRDPPKQAGSAFSFRKKASALQGGTPKVGKQPMTEQTVQIPATWVFPLWRADV